jgi:hypothetical protein
VTKLSPQALRGRKARGAAPAEGLQAALEEELERLQARFQLCGELKVLWRPGAENGLSGEVRDGTIYVYEEDELRAVQTLKHELVDYVITSRLVKPLVDLINLLIRSKEAEVYREKERVVEALSKLL